MASVSVVDTWSWANYFAWLASNYLPPTVDRFGGVQQLTVLGFALCQNFSVKAHTVKILTRCTRTFCELKTLHKHEITPQALHTVFQCKHSWPTPLQLGSDSLMPSVGVHWRSSCIGRSNLASAFTFASFSDHADQQLFFKICHHICLLLPLLPPYAPKTYQTRTRGHDFYPPPKTTCPDECNFISRYYRASYASTVL